MPETSSLKNASLAQSYSLPHHDTKRTNHGPLLLLLVVFFLGETLYSCKAFSTSCTIGFMQLYRCDDYTELTSSSSISGWPRNPTVVMAETKCVAVLACLACMSDLPGLHGIAISQMTTKPLLDQEI